MLLRSGCGLAGCWLSYARALERAADKGQAAATAGTGGSFLEQQASAGAGAAAKAGAEVEVGAG